MRTTHTYALLEVTAAAYDEIASKLRGCGYGSSINDQGEIDMHGIALVCAHAPTSTQEKTMPPETVPSTSDERTVNNVMRHAYRVLSDDEKAAMQKLKDDGLGFHEYVNSLGASRELSIAKTKIEEAVMWAVKHITR
jgi:hypothetical protein